VERIIVGTSTKGLDIEMFKLGDGPFKILLLGGVHGDEPEGYTFMENFLRRGDWKPYENKLSIYVIPRVNPDACLANTRLNANGVDLNRNMPTKDWSPKAATERYVPGPEPASEAETKVLMKIVQEENFGAILSYHSFDPMININGPAREWGEVMSSKCGYKVTEDMGYATPGSFGTWAGAEKSIPTVTYEIERDMDHEQSWLMHYPTLLAGLDYWVSVLEKKAETK
jgi:protein MpaA